MRHVLALPLALIACCTGLSPVEVAVSADVLDTSLLAPDAAGDAAQDPGISRPRADASAGPTDAQGAADAGIAMDSLPSPLLMKALSFKGIVMPSTPAAMASVTSGAALGATWSDGTKTAHPLVWKPLFRTGDPIAGKGPLAGSLWSAKGAPLLDDSVAGPPQPIIANTPDGTSLLPWPGAKPVGVAGHALGLVTHYEYVTLTPGGDLGYGQFPMAISLTTLDQDPKAGTLAAIAYQNLDLTLIHGLWLPCAGGPSPWGTHLGSEEYEPDARCWQEGTCAATGKLTVAGFAAYFGDAKTARPYWYGHVPEVTLGGGGAKVVKHWVLGRLSRELVRVLPDQRTVYMGDDGSWNGLFLFVADQPADLSAGTLYAARWQQTAATDGGKATLLWHRLGHATDAEVSKLADTLVFSDIFLAEDKDPKSAAYQRVRTYQGQEWLQLKPGMATAAAFLETRRYAALRGATTEFQKMEGVAVAAADQRVYVSISTIAGGMQAEPGAAQDHIQLPFVAAGAVYELGLAAGQKDAGGQPIASDHVAVTMQARIRGIDLPAADAMGNAASLAVPAQPDNLAWSPHLRTLFIGEDGGGHVNNLVWAFQPDSGALAIVAAVPVGAETSGLQAIDDLNGFAYVTLNFQHPGGGSTAVNAELVKNWGPGLHGGVGYLHGLPRPGGP
ncbi:MAG: DUF839 domain-containing protein [Myxococcales bacterium]|nr:DUF839 domain-containing protein [Myxococcales bacterium]